MQLPCIILQYNVRGLLDAVRNNRINDVKEHLHNKVNVNGNSIVSWLPLCFKIILCLWCVRMFLFMYVYMNVYACMFACIYVCMHASMYMYVTIPLQNIFAVKKGMSKKLQVLVII